VRSGTLVASAYGCCCGHRRSDEASLPNRHISTEQISPINSAPKSQPPISHLPALLSHNTYQTPNINMHFTLPSSALIPLSISTASAKTRTQARTECEGKRNILYPFALACCTQRIGEGLLGLGTVIPSTCLQTSLIRQSHQSLLTFATDQLQGTISRTRMRKICVLLDQELL
jgi:hypothetical protein